MSISDKHQSIHVHADFPGGNIRVLNITDNRLQLAQDLRDTEGHWFYWHCCIENVAGKILTIELCDTDLLTHAGPLVSFDQQQSYHWLGIEEESGFTVNVPADCSSIYLGMCHPYTQRNLDRTLARFEKHPLLNVANFCNSNDGLEVPTLHLGKANESQPSLLITARHHACETTPSFMIDGIIEAYLTDPSPAFTWLRDNVHMQIIPFMDMDGVEAGDQGKNRKPYDHNRDYNDLKQPIYAEVKTLKALVRSWPKEDHTLSIDLHCPWIKHTWNEHSYFVGVKDQNQWKKTQLLSEAIENNMTGELPFSREGNLPYGVAWNTDTSYGDSIPKSCGKWSDVQKAIHLGGTIETPYANVGDKLVNPQNATDWGKDILRGASIYLQQR